MHGFFEDYENAVDCVRQLQQHIYDRLGESETEPPQVSLSLGPHAAVIDVMSADGEIQLWHSEADSPELTPQTLIAIYATKCETMARQFVA
jgi:hypothetical protein